MMDGRGKSDSPIVPKKLPNKAVEPAAEAVEERGLAKGNPQERNALRTQSRACAHSALGRIRQAAREDGKQRFTALLHHVYDTDILRSAYFAMKRTPPPVSMARRGNTTGNGWRSVSGVCPNG